MERSPVRDFLVGLFVLAGIGAMAYLSVTVAGFSWRGRGGLKLSAAFDETGGLTTRSPVVIAGVRVGEVTKISLVEDEDGNFRARVQMDLDPTLKLTTDTAARITTAGLLGDRFIELVPGNADKILSSGEKIAKTQPAVVLEQLIGDAIDRMGNSPTPAPATTAPGR